MMIPPRGRSWLLVAALSISCAPYLTAADSSKAVTEALDIAASLPVEEAADLTFAVLDAGTVSDKEASTYLESLFQRASEAKRNYPFVLAPIQGDVDQEIMVSYMLSYMNLDATSIRIRVLKRLNAMNPRLARQLTNYLPHDFPGTVGCGDIVVPVPGDHYYSTLLEAFPDIYESLVSQITTPQEAAALIIALTQPTRIPRERYPFAYSQVARVLDGSRVSDRAFTTTELTLKLGLNIEEALKEKTLPAGSGTMLATAWVGYVDRQLRSERCPDVLTQSGEDMALKFTLPRAQRLAADYKFPPLEQAAIAPAFSTKRYQNRATGDADEETDRIFALLAKVRPGGAESAQSELAQELQRYGDRELSESLEKLSQSSATFKI